MQNSKTPEATPAYSYPQFTEEMRKTYKILVPNMLPVQLGLICRLMKNYGYDMELLHKTNNGRDINRHYYSTAEIDENLQRPVVKALNALAKFRNELDAFDGTFSYSADGDTSISFTWEGTTTQATLTFEPGRGLGVENTASVATLEWRDAAGEHRTDDLIANPPVVA